VSVRLGEPCPHVCCDGRYVDGVQERGYDQPFGTYRCKCSCHPDRLMPTQEEETR